MTHHQDPVAAGEFILRRIHKNHCSPGLPRAVHFAGFRPGKEATTGLSVYREKYVSPAAVAAAGRKPGEYYVVRLPMQALLDLGLTVGPEAAVGVPGHAVIPELGLSAYEQDKQRLRDVLMELARLASSAIVLTPE